MPPRKVKEISEMAKGMGCADVFFRSYTKEDIYDTLGVTANASLDEISSKYRELAKELHPDRNPDGEERMKEVIQAYEIARDEEKRRLYDFEMRADLALDSSETDYLRSTNSKMA
jgi:DnaJ-class molecular chaperone